MYCVRLLQLLLAIKTVYCMRLHILTQDSQILTRVGQNLTLPCIAKGKNFDPFSNQVIWYKVADNGEEFQINTGAVIGTPYAETGRYTVDHKMMYEKISTLEMPLSIKGLTLAENGTYRCTLRGRSKVLSSIIHRVGVIGPITKLHMSNSNKYMNNRTKQEVFEFTENQPSTVICDFEGSGPPPTIHIIRGEVDISTLFVRTESIEIIGEPGLQYSMHHIEYKSTNLKMERAHNGEKLYCVAQVPTFTELSLTKTAVIKVLYAPEFSCDTELLATIGEVDLEISCRISANPPVEVNNVWWTFSEREWNLTNGQSREDFSTNIVLEDDVAIATLTIANVSNSSFQTYYLTAHTEIAIIKHAIILEEDIPTTAAITETITTELTTEGFTTQESTTVAVETKKVPTTTLTTPPQRSISTIAPTIATFKSLQTVPTRVSTLETSTHKRRKHRKDKHKNRKHKTPSSERTTTISTLVSTTNLDKSIIQDTTEKEKKNKISDNKTAEKHENSADVQYTIIDEPVKENNAKTPSSGSSLYNTSNYGFSVLLLVSYVFFIW